ncbi:MAG: carboxypeptidase-like regulatory domain-containing protein [Bacteroidales bacterium]|nr:carboxypeptidase-like regulatory domain-containing protein [Bacteroidales bacterium]
MIQRVLFLALSLGILGESTASVFQDTAAYLSIQGRIVDDLTGNPVVFANVYLAGSNIGTVSNSDGEFIVKIPLFIENISLVISNIGYRNIELSMDELDPENNLIKLEPIPIPLEEVTIIHMNARELLIAAIEKIPDNYSRNPVMVTSFYRESIRQNRKYVAVSEGVLDGYKASYSHVTDMDRVKIFKGRKSSDVRKMDTIVLKLQGGPQSIFQLDLVKNPAELLEREMMEYYQYEIHGIVSIDDRQAYVISFDQLPQIDVPLYTGKYYIGVNNLAFMGAEFRLSEKMIDKASQYMVKRKPPGLRVDIEKANYLVKYRISNGQWYLAYVRSELILGIKWKKKLFRSRYTSLAEMAVTNIDPENITRYKFRETTKSSDIFVDQVSDFEDSDFWGEYNIIQPEESIQAAIERIGRKLKRSGQ